MKDYLVHLNEQISDAVSIGREFSKTSRRPQVSRILFCGMGGSAISGEILKVLFSGICPIPFEINRDSRLPFWVDSKTLLICSSYSGNTEEVLSVLEQAKNRKSKILAITSGGNLAEKGPGLNLGFLRLPGGIPPRCAIGYLTFSLIPIFEKWGWLKFSPQDRREVLDLLRRDLGKTPRELAGLMSQYIVRFYGPAKLFEPVLMRWQAQFAENSKVLASYQMIPEMFHNEIEGYYSSKHNPQKFLAVFFRDPKEPVFLKGKMEQAKQLVKRSGNEVFEIYSKGKSLLARLFYLIYLGDWVSYELALLRGVDPLQILNISLLKGNKRLGSSK